MEGFCFSIKYLNSLAELNIFLKYIFVKTQPI